MKKRYWVPLFGFLFAIGTASVSADELQLPEPKKVLRQIFKALGTQGSYHVSCSVLGGISKTRDHAVSVPTVSENYQASVYGRVLHVPDLMAFVTPKKGAIRNPENHELWHQTLAIDPGRRLEKFFLFPHTVIGDALDGPQSVEWVWVGDEVDETEVSEREPKRGSTAVVATEEKSRGIPHVIRVAMPEKVSLNQFVRIQNSGCLSEG